MRVIPHGTNLADLLGDAIGEKEIMMLPPVPNQELSTQDPPVFKTERNQHEVRCGMCGRIIYVEEETFSFVSDAIKAGLDNPFRCASCKMEYDDLVYEG